MIKKLLKKKGKKIESNVGFGAFNSAFPAEIKKAKKKPKAKKKK